MKHLLIAVVTALFVAATASTAAAIEPPPHPSPSHTIKHQYASDLPHYRGWGTVDSREYFTCPVGQYCTAQAWKIPAPAYRWNSRWGWQKLTRPSGASVYVWPFTTGWGWTWTRATGWLAMQSNTVFIRTVTVPCEDATGTPCPIGL